jgi:hypothetical protein
VFICQSVRELDLPMLLIQTESDYILYKKYGSGYLIVLRYSSSSEKRHSAVDQFIASLDKTWMGASGATSFVSVSDVGSGKVKSFSGRDRLNDYLFREIFDVRRGSDARGDFELLSGVKRWDMSIQREEENAQSIARERDDILVQRQAMEEDPDAFGGHSVFGGSSKMVASGESQISVAGGLDPSASESSTEDVGGVVESQQLHLLGQEGSGAQQTVPKRPRVERPQPIAVLAVVQSEGLSVQGLTGEASFGVELSDAAGSKERRRLERAIADKEEAIAQRDSLLLSKLEVEQQLKDAHARIARFPGELNEAVRRKHTQFEMEGAAQVREEVLKMKTKFEGELEARVLTEMARMKKGFEEQRDSMVMAEVAKLKALHEEEVAKLKESFEEEKEDMIDEIQMDEFRTGFTLKQQEKEISVLKEEIEKLRTACGPLQEDQISALKEEIKRLRAARGPLLRDLDDMRRKLRLMQTRRDQCRGFEGADEANIDPVEDEEALMTVTEKLRRDLKYTEERLGAAEAWHQGLERSFAAARQEWASEKKGLQAQLEGKDREAHELVAAAMSDAVVKERWGMLPKFAEVQAEYDRRAAECAQRLEAQAEAHREQVQRMQKGSVEAETRWRQAVERMEDEREDLEEELAMLELRASAGVVSGESGEVVEVVVEQVPKPDHDRLLASERAIAAQAVHHSAEAVRLLEAEQTKVRNLLERLELGPDTAAGQAVEAEKQRAESARQAAEEQAKRAARMEAEAKDAKQELAKRMDAGRAMLGEVYRSYEEVLKDNRQLRARLAKVDKLRQEAGLRVESALASEKRAKDFVEVLKGQRGGADPDDQAQALRAAELCLHAEIALRHDAEAKVARLNLQRRGDQARLVQLQSELREADARAEEVSSQMRGGPFAGF